MRKIRLALVGFGNVGQAFARLVTEKREELEAEYGITPVVTGIITGRHGAFIDLNGLNLERALSLLAQGQSLAVLDTHNFTGDTMAFIQTCPADVMFETTPVNPISGQPALDHLRHALEHGMHVVTANKGPVVYGYHELTELAARKRRGFRFESAVMDGAPIFSLFRQPLRGARLISFTGILNSCTNLLLERMGQGETLEEAIAYGASIGITETDPSNDVDGWDAAIKVAALCTVLMHHPITPQEIDRTGIRGITAPMIQEALAAGERWKLVCSANLEDGKLTARVRPERVNSESPLFNVGGTSSFVLLKTDVLPGLGLLESNTEPETTAYGLLADFINAVTH